MLRASDAALPHLAQAMAKERKESSVEGDVYKWLGHAHNKMGDAKRAEELFTEGGCRHASPGALLCKEGWMGGVNDRGWVWSRGRGAGAVLYRKMGWVFCSGCCQRRGGAITKVCWKKWIRELMVDVVIRRWAPSCGPSEKWRRVLSKEGV